MPPARAVARRRAAACGRSVAHRRLSRAAEPPQSEPASRGPALSLLAALSSSPLRVAPSSPRYRFALTVRLPRRDRSPGRLRSRRSRYPRALRPAAAAIVALRLVRDLRVAPPRY
ncbi:hypothetical protein Scep_004534 [Stephania cephalantha]|uniref:Uncharacterized protein n=1 Tax=Stephania cephalantha TaxID=152367 RepID=A0AAP0PWQ8_9MAGN